MIELVKAQLECAKKSWRYYSDQLDKKIGHKNCLIMALGSVLFVLIIAFMAFLAYMAPPQVVNIEIDLSDKCRIHDPYPSS